LADMLADSVEKAGAKTLGDTLRDVEIRALVDTLADNLPVAKAEIHCHKLGDVEALALVALLADTLPKAKPEPHCKRLTKTEPRQSSTRYLTSKQLRRSGPLAKPKAIWRPRHKFTETDTLPDSLGEKLANTLVYVEAETLIDTPADTLGLRETKALDEILSNREDEPLNQYAS